MLACQNLGTNPPCSPKGCHPSLGLSVFLRERRGDLRVLRAPTFLPRAVSGKVGIEEDVDTHEEDGIEATDTGPESMFLGCLDVTWNGWEKKKDR